MLYQEVVVIEGALLWGLLVEAGVRPMPVVLVKALSRTQPPSDPK